ncbi:polysaccharide deacetylase [Sulfitobacter albidus]|uniref:Polysaccharide deacetylase n=1 Tax=Sulfitobacter albidus TaxID=2829501 RepID=A0A975JC74_9RHOB|nr:polysaccharide deacetylase [Sulfitobacter albidus]QUJ75804.1 polysaccharide deacetylase [Sulfitobacter albidus]
MADWGALAAELALWRDAGLAPRLWWRDDDAQTVTPALERLLSLAQTHHVPAHISVIPEGLAADLAPRLNACPQALVLQHGLRHVNHEPKGAPASEVGATRPLDAQRADLAEGWAILSAAGFDRLLPALVPPWNRIGDATRARLPDWGYRYLSNYEGRGEASPVPGLGQIDAHLDPIRWKCDRVFRGEGKMLAMLLDHLRTRRAGDPRAPIGYVTHHLQTEDAVWDFSDRLFAATPGLWHALPDLED